MMSSPCPCSTYRGPFWVGLYSGDTMDCVRGPVGDVSIEGLSSSDLADMSGTDERCCSFDSGETR